MSTTLNLSIAVGVCLVGGCATIKVSSEVAADARWASYQTYGWFSETQMKTGNPRIDNHWLNAYIRSEIDRQLLACGYQRAFDGSPDVLVTYAASLQTKFVVTSVKLCADYVPAWGTDTWSNRSLGTRGTYIRRYEQGTLVVEVIDARASRLIWRGTAKTEVDASDSARAKKAKVRAAVGHLLRCFPRKR